MTKPRIGFVGTGWIGLNRMEAILGTGAVTADSVVEPSVEMAERARALAPGAVILDSLDAMLERGVDGVVIATPSALHADQAVRALAAGAAVFCQKPLGRNAFEARAVVEAARRADRLLSVDFSYRHTAAMQAIAPLVREGGLGRLQLIDLVFHNAYGPDKEWFYDRARSGGGCVMDLGVHLIDLALWLLDFPEVEVVAADLFAGGAPQGGRDAVEDLALATLRAGDCTIRLACSWRVHAGRDAVIEARLFGTDGGAAMENVGGSFYDFTAHRFTGTAGETLASPPDAWGGRAAAEWADRLGRGNRFDAAAGQLIGVSEVVDRIYAAAGSFSVA